MKENHQLRDKIKQLIYMSLKGEESMQSTKKNVKK